MVPHSLSSDQRIKNDDFLRACWPVRSAIPRAGLEALGKCVPKPWASGSWRPVSTAGTTQFAEKATRLSETGQPRFGAPSAQYSRTQALLLYLGSVRVCTTLSGRPWMGAARP